MTDIGAKPLVLIFLGGFCCGVPFGIGLAGLVQTIARWPW